MTDTPLYCECGNRLGLRRSDGTYVSARGGRTVTVPPNILRDFKEATVACEDCQRLTEVDSLSVDKVS